MLVLTRKLMEKLFIGEDICVTVVRLDGGQVRLGIEAPRNVTVVRAELVPERTGPTPPTPADDPRRVPAPHRAAAQVKTPPALARGTDSRRRGPSR